MPNAVELVYEQNINVQNNMVSIKPKRGLKAVNIPTNSYITPETENIPVSIGEHAYHQYDSVVWLEDYSYAFEDNVASGTSNVIGNARSVSGVGATPMSEGIVATQDGKAYNPAYSYEYYWQ